MKEMEGNVTTDISIPKRELKCFLAVDLRYIKQKTRKEQLNDLLSMCAIVHVKNCQKST